MVSVKIYTFGRFEVTFKERPLPDEAWHGRRSQYFLIALIILGGKQVSKEEIIDLLWPEAEGDRSVANFHTTLSRLRRTLGFASDHRTEFIHLKDSFLSLNPQSCWCDCCVFEESVRLAKCAEASARWYEAQRYLQQAKILYQGEFLLPFRQEAWIEIKRQELHQQFDWVEQRFKAPALAA